MNIFSTLGLNPKKTAVNDLYDVIVANARRPEFYTVLGVPDTVNGRYDVIILHTYFVMKRLKAIGAEASTTSQALFDCMFADMDKNLREMGVGDLSVGKKVKAMATAFYGRIKAYDEGLEGGKEHLANSLRRNLFAEAEPTDRQVSAMANLLSDQVQASSTWSLGHIEKGAIGFITPPNND
ncbi:MAG: hypothetical protein CBD27_09820 [Rhodospirillaceae bacterium TMED167]|nr:hypothetical protein [Rhodospirillaceae bacterium]OUW25163.1 MAG: hypothetical protein CBD27_09820 [Rhodospirillaceae bacterium TMED167]